MFFTTVFFQQCLQFSIFNFFSIDIFVLCLSSQNHQFWISKTMNPSTLHWDFATVSFYKYTSVCLIFYFLLKVKSSTCCTSSLFGLKLDMFKTLKKYDPNLKLFEQQWLYEMYYHSYKMNKGVRSRTRLCFLQYILKKSHIY